MVLGVYGGYCGPVTGPNAKNLLGVALFFIIGATLLVLVLLKTNRQGQ